MLYIHLGSSRYVCRDYICKYVYIYIYIYIYRHSLHTYTFYHISIYIYVHICANMYCLLFYRLLPITYCLNMMQVFGVLVCGVRGGFLELAHVQAAEILSSLLHAFRHEHKRTSRKTYSIMGDMNHSDSTMNDSYYLIFCVVCTISICIGAPKPHLRLNLAAGVFFRF